MNRKVSFLASAIGVSLFIVACAPATETPTPAPPVVTPPPATSPEVVPPATPPEVTPQPTPVTP